MWTASRAMNPVEIGIGKSFKGLAAYLLHDPERAASSERVAWVESFNLDGADPEKSWRLMAATAMSADQLKAAAGIKKGKAAKNTAYHFSLNFNPKDGPSAEVQRAAVESALKALGLEKHQALAVAHRDTAHQHVHVMVNLISPENGLSAASKQPDGKSALLSNSQRKLSQWAQRFEREHGLIVTEGRLENANKRAQGEQVDASRKPRNVHEQEKTEPSYKRSDLAKSVFNDRAHDLAQAGRTMHRAHSGQWDALKTSYRHEKDAMKREADKAMPAAIAELKERNKPRWAMLFAQQREETRAFERGERSVLGRIWHGAAVFRDRALDGDALGGFLAAFSKEERIAIVQRKHDHERTRMGLMVRDEITELIGDFKQAQQQEQKRARGRFLVECNYLKKQQGIERIEQRGRWSDHNTARRESFSKARERGRTLQQGRDLSMQRGRGLEPS